MTSRWWEWHGTSCAADNCQLQFTGVEGGQGRNLRPLATETEGSGRRRSGARPHRATRRRQPGRRQTARRGHPELRINYGPGYLQDGDTLVVLLCGGEKSTQDDDRKNAKRIANEWKETRNDDQDH
jgi:putative addiction module killer protein